MLYIWLAGGEERLLRSLRSRWESSGEPLSRKARKIQHDHVEATLTRSRGGIGYTTG
jgi:hypothetical protein